MVVLYDSHSLAGFSQTMHKDFHDISMTISQFPMTVSVLKFCIRIILQKRPENEKLCKLMLNFSMSPEKGTHLVKFRGELVKFHDGSENSMTTLIFQVFQSFCFPVKGVWVVERSKASGEKGWCRGFQS